MSTAASTPDIAAIVRQVIAEIAATGGGRPSATPPAPHGSGSGSFAEIGRAHV